MEARLSSKIRVLPSGRLSETLDSGKFRHRMAIVTVCFSRSSTNVDAQRDKLDRRWSTKLTILAMVDGCCSPVSTARCARGSGSRGLPATADTLCYSPRDTIELGKFCRKQLVVLLSA